MFHWSTGESGVVRQSSRSLQQQASDEQSPSNSDLVANIAASPCLRTLILLLLAIGGVLHRGNVQREAVEAIAKGGGRVIYDSQLPARSKPAAPRWPKGLVDHLGPEYFKGIDTVIFQAIPNRGPKIQFDEPMMAQVGQLDGLKTLFLGDVPGGSLTDAGLAHLGNLRGLTRLSIAGSSLTDAGLATLAEFDQLENLNLIATPMTDAGLVHLRGLTRLINLELRTNAGIHGPGLAHLAGMTQLKRLLLDSTPINDEGLSHLAGLTKLEILNTSSPHITDAGPATSKGS